MTVEMLNDTPQSLCPNCIHAELYNGRTDGEITHQLLNCQVMIYGRQRSDCEYYEKKKKEMDGGEAMRSSFEEDKQEVGHALQRLAMLQFFFADNQPSLSQQITSDLLTVKVFLDTYYDKIGDE